jgi:hypothetical protein
MWGGKQLGRPRIAPELEKTNPCRSKQAWPHGRRAQDRGSVWWRDQFGRRDWLKALELLHELLPTAKVMALLLNPDDRALAQAQAREMLSAARNRKLELHVLNARSESDFDAVFADIKRLRVDGLVIGAGSVFLAGSKKLADLTIRHAVPAIYLYRDFTVAGGLMNYGPRCSERPRSKYLHGSGICT